MKTKNANLYPFACTRIVQTLYHGRKEELMANFSAINNIYNFYLTTYAPKSDSKFDTHKKSELRGVYNSIVKMNKEAPLFIVDKSQETKEYAVGLKENARAFHNTIASLGGTGDDEMLNKKVAYSTNEDLASATYIGEDSEEELPEIDLFVEKLATNQVNSGKYIPADSLYLAEDTYSFDIGVNGLNYEFQYNVKSDDTNKLVQEKLARLITNAKIGLSAEVTEDGNGNSSIKIASDNTGETTNGGLMFVVSDANTTRTKGSVAYFGLDNVTQLSTNSKFSVNGEDFETAGNIFTVDKKFEIAMNRVSSSDEETAHIALKDDIESIAENLNTLVEGYNSFIDKAEAYSEVHPKSNRLVAEMSTLANLHKEELASVGLNIEEDGHIVLDKDALKEAAATGDISENIGALKHFAGSMLRKTDQVSINPMHYADRTIVAYKNPGHNYATPYVTSAYTGMMFNSYC